MPRVTIQQTNFTAGEVSPRVIGRTDIDRYANAAAVIQNAHPVIHGGAKSRDGTFFVTAAKYAAKKNRLVPYIVSRDEAYMLEFGDLYLRVFPAGGGAQLAEVVSPYTESMLPDFDYVQGADTMFMAHPSVPIQRLRKFSSTVWDLSAAPFLTLPFDEQGITPAVVCTLSAAAVGAGRTATAAAATFLPTDVGRNIISGAGLGVITGYTSSAVVVVNITIAFSSTNLAASSWTVDSSPQAIVKPSAKDPVASSISLYGSQSRAADLTLTAKTGSITVTASASVFVPGDTGLTLYADSGVVVLTYVSGTQCTGTTSSDFISTTYSAGGWGITASTWRAADVGSYVRINTGLAKITSQVSASEVKATIITALTGTVAAPPLAWSLETPVWDSIKGYPRTVTLHEQRLIAAGSKQYPQTIWGSRIAEYLDFTKGTADSDSYSFTIAADEINPIGYVASLRNLIVHTYGGEFSLQGGVEKPITPTNVRIRAETPHGSKSVRPVLIGRESVFVQRAGRKVRAMSYSYGIDGYAAPDLAVLAEHITESGITQLAYQQEPDLLLWAVRADGTMLTCTIDRDQQVIGWARHYTDGAWESVATIPNGDHEETWCTVRRTVNGATVRYVERFDGAFKPILASTATGYPPLPSVDTYGCTVDSGLTFDNAAGQTVFNLPHLIGKTVAIVADGLVMPSQVVDGSGNVTLTRPAFRALIGLGFTVRITPLNPEVSGGGNGTSQGNSMRTSEITLRLLSTLGCKIEGSDGFVQEVPFRKFGTAVLDNAPGLKTQSVRIEVLGWERGNSTFTIVQDQPLPLHVLAIVRKFQTND